MAEIVNAHPTKKLIAYVLTKDIKLEDAILDLIDNSIDGARRLGKTDLKGFNVTVTLNEEYFRIEDNCGGIPYEIARDYAFRFGKPEIDLPIDGPADMIGNFGVGMKRALFKMGKLITVRSCTPNKTFSVVIDVPKWLAENENWNFEFSHVKNVKTPIGKTGTFIEVSDLYPGVAEQYKLRQFSATLKALTREKQTLSLINGLTISIGSDSITGMPMRLMASREIKPYYRKDTINQIDGAVTVEIYAGLDVPDNDSAGWYVICNGRTILNADRTAATGWGNKWDGDRVPSYHHQYARFRGYLIFHSDNPSLLPWNTTKTGVDAEHPLYRKFLLEMITSMRQVFSFLNAIDRESDVAAQPLTEKMQSLKSISLEKIKTSEIFSFPTPSVIQEKKEKLRWIRYQRPNAQVEQLMQALEVDRPEQVGETTFDLYYSLNIEQ